MRTHIMLPALLGPTRPLPLLGLLLALTGLACSPTALAHGGQIEVGGSEKGPVTLTAAQQKAIGLQTVTADFHPLEELLNLNGEVRLAPGRQADVSTRISGQITAVYVNLGDSVKAGQRMARVQARLVGDPPPSVNITAPMSGVVDTQNVLLGQSVEPASVLYRLSDRSQVNVVAKLYEEDAEKVKVGQQARIHTLSYPSRVFTGKVSFIGPSLDPQSRTLEVWIKLANPGGLLKPNLFAQASIVLKSNAAALAVARAAIIEANGEKFVFVRDGGKFTRVEITTGSSDGQFTEVTDGLVPGDTVVTQGNRQLYTLWLTGGKAPKGGDD